MPDLKRVGRAAIPLWSLLISVGVIALAGSVMLPSTKRARIHLRPADQELPANSTTTTTGPATLPQ